MLMEEVRWYFRLSLSPPSYAPYQQLAPCVCGMSSCGSRIHFSRKGWSLTRANSKKISPTNVMGVHPGAEVGVGLDVQERGEEDPVVPSVAGAELELDAE